MLYDCLLFERVAGKQASRLRLKPARASPARPLRPVAGKQASRLRLKHPVATAQKKDMWQVAGKQASRLRLKRQYFRRQACAFFRCGEASVASAIETPLSLLSCALYRQLRGSKRRVCD